MKPCKKCGGTDRYKNGNCRPCHKAYCIEWRKNNQSHSNEWKKRHRNKTKESNAKWSAKNPEKVRQHKNKYRLANLEKSKIAIKNWQIANPEKLKIYKQNRRAREKKNGGKLSPGLPSRLMKLQKGKCACCRVKLEKYHLDHIIPLSLGGPNVDSNIQLLCPTCNLSKNDKHPVDFMRSRGFLL